MNYKEYEVPKNLRFKMEDILAMKGFQGSFLVEQKNFPSVFRKEEKLKTLMVKVKMSVLSKEVLSQGVIYGELEVVCDKCLKPFVRKFEESFSTLTSKLDKIIDIMYITEQTLPLVSGIQNLCSKNCKGLCSQCGANLNETTCNCKKEIFTPFACLKEKFELK